MTNATIITVCLNPGPIMDRTVRSIIAQPDRPQWIVVDGGSNDGTPQMLRSLTRPPDILVSEPDAGIANAFNKGIRLATAETVLFMNAGDEFAYPGCIAELIRTWDRHRHRWIVGAGDILREDGSLLFRRCYSRTPDDHLSLVRTNCRIMHQAVLAERSLFSEHGGFDESFRIAMDYELWIRWLTRGIIPQMVDHPVCRFWRGGASSNPLRNNAENRRAREMHGIGNGRLGEAALAGLARLKALAGGRYGKWAYRLKEKIGIRI